MPTPTIVIERVTVMALSDKYNKEIVFDNRVEVTFDDKMPDDDAKNAFSKMDGNVARV